MSFLRLWLVGLWLGLLSLAGWAAPTADADLVAIPALTARVTDLTNTVSIDILSRLEQQLAAFESRKGAQVVVLILPTTQPESIEQFGIRLFDAWKVGRKGVDDGVMVIVARNDRRLRIEVGYGLEGALNDATAKRIIDEIMAPLFRQGDMPGGLQAGVDAILKVVDGEALPPPQARASSPAGQQAGELSGIVVLFLIFAAIIGGATLRYLLGNLVGCTIAAGVGGSVFWFFEHALENFFAGAAVGLFLSLVISEGKNSRGGSSDLLGNILGGILNAIFSGGGGGGGGGFGGGGGSGGGGGASGSW